MTDEDRDQILAHAKHELDDRKARGMALGHAWDIIDLLFQEIERRANSNIP